MTNKEAKFTSITTAEGVALDALTFKPKGEDPVMSCYIQTYTVDALTSIMNGANVALKDSAVEAAIAGRLSNVRNHVKAERIPAGASGFPEYTHAAILVADAVAAEGGKNGLAVYRESLASIGMHLANMGRSVAAVDKLGGLLRNQDALRLQSVIVRTKVQDYVEGWFSSLNDELATVYGNTCEKWLDACEGVKATEDNPEDDF